MKLVGIQAQCTADFQLRDFFDFSKKIKIVSLRFFGPIAVDLNFGGANSFAARQFFVYKNTNEVRHILCQFIQFCFRRFDEPSVPGLPATNTSRIDRVLNTQPWCVPTPSRVSSLECLVTFFLKKNLSLRFLSFRIF